jgi:hypothetical protein
MVRPFFQTDGIPLTQEQQPEQQQQSEVKNESGSEGKQGTATSSEGFKFQAPCVRQGASNNNANVVNNNGPPCMPDAVAGPTRQHSRDEESSAGTSSSSSNGKRVRIQEQQNQNQHRRQVQVLQEHAPAGVILPLARLQQQEMSSSSSSSGGREQQLDGHQPRNNFGVPPRVVTDVSSSNRTDSAVSNPNTSGSGSAGNSGNDNKGSSEDRVKEGDNSGEGTNEGSDGAGSEGQKKIVLGVDNIVVHRHDAILPEQATSDDMGTKGTGGRTRERKLVDKKRKRIEMRREYEAQQQPSESSASSTSRGDHLLRPGKAVSMDEVLFLSKIPR